MQGMHDLKQNGTRLRITGGKRMMMQYECEEARFSGSVVVCSRQPKANEAAVARASGGMHGYDREQRYA